MRKWSTNRWNYARMVEITQWVQFWGDSLLERKQETQHHSLNFRRPLHQPEVHLHRRKQHRERRVPLQGQVRQSRRRWAGEELHHPAQGRPKVPLAQFQRHGLPYLSPNAGENCVRETRWLAELHSPEFYYFFVEEENDNNFQESDLRWLMKSQSDKLKHLCKMWVT